MRSTSRIEPAGLIDQIVESAVHPARAEIETRNATRKRPGAMTRSKMRRTVVGTKNANATHPHDCEKYAPWLAFAAVTTAAVAKAITQVRARRVRIADPPCSPTAALLYEPSHAASCGTVLLVIGFGVLGWVANAAEPATQSAPR